MKVKHIAVALFILFHISGYFMLDFEKHKDIGPIELMWIFSYVPIVVYLIAIIAENWDRKIF